VPYRSQSYCVACDHDPRYVGQSQATFALDWMAALLPSDSRMSMNEFDGSCPSPDPGDNWRAPQTPSPTLDADGTRGPMSF
jgi:hypothetical protein